MATRNPARKPVEVGSIYPITLPETNSSHLKITPWKRRFLLETIIFRGYVSCRECIYKVSYMSGGCLGFLPSTASLCLCVFGLLGFH